MFASSKEQIDPSCHLFVTSGKSLRFKTSLNDQKGTKAISICTVGHEYENIMCNLSHEEFSRVIQREPFDNKKMDEHVRNIKTNRWEELDCSDPAFERNLFKALRLEKITADEMVTADLLFHAHDLFKSKVRQYSYEEKGPYELSHIEYATERTKADFFLKLKRLQKHEQCYFSINCEKNYEMMFLIYGIAKDHFFKMPLLGQILGHYVRQLTISMALKNELLDYISQLPDAEDSLVNKARQKFFEIINRENRQAFEFYTYSRRGGVFSEDFDSPRFALAISSVFEQHPFFEISPDYRENNPKSPLLCRIIPSMASFKVLHEVMHGAANAMLPHYTVGKISLNMIRMLDEKPEIYGARMQSRPIELVHPEIEKNQAPHNFHAHSFELTSHDLFHCWRAGGLMLKSFLRYLRSLHDRRDFTMSKAHWCLTDMDSSAGHQLRVDLMSTTETDSVYKQYILSLLNLYLDHKSLSSVHDEHVLLVFDMIKNRNLWKSMTGFYPEDVFQEIAAIDYSRFQRFLNIYHPMEVLLKRYANKPIKNEAMFFIVAFRMKNDVEGLQALGSMDASKDGLENFFCWTRNRGIYLKASVSRLPEKHRSIEAMSAKFLSSICCDFVEDMSPKSVFHQLSGLSLFKPKLIGLAAFAVGAGFLLNTYR